MGATIFNNILKNKMHFNPAILIDFAELRLGSKTIIMPNLLG
jgi:hypothetical protein